MIKAHKPKAPFEAACQLAKAELDRPENHFDITKLPLQIEYECVEPFRSQTEIDVWGGGSAHDQAQCTSLINRMNDILHAEELRAIFHPSKEPSILKVLDRFFSDSAVRTLRISLEFLPILHRTREIITNAIARTLLGLARQSRFRTQPLVVVLDEAHQALSSKLSDLSQDFPLEAFNIIAKEGRKYGLTVCLATQRPRDIPEDVLSQMGTFIAHRLVNDGDRSAVERATGSAHAELISLLPTLAPGEAFIIGVDFPTPLRVLVSAPINPPNSRGPDYQKLWRKPAP
jgi:DNA helicase HerA-like ATPase